MIEVQRTSYGKTAFTLLADQIDAAKSRTALAPVTVVVPSNYAAVSIRRELARHNGRGIVRVSFLTLHRLAERLGAPALATSGRRPLSAPVLIAAVRGALRREPGVFAAVADHPATELAIADIYRELRCVAPHGLDALAARSSRAADVVRLTSEVRTNLVDNWFDEHDVVVAARTNARAHDGVLVVHLPQHLSSAGGDLLHAIAAHTPIMVNVGASGVVDADRPVVAALERAGISVPPPGDTPRPTASHVMSLSDPDEEARAAVRIVVDAAREGVPLGRMAVLFGAANPYARLVREHFDAAGIAVNGTPVRTIGNMTVGHLLRSLLALPDRRFGRSDVLSVLSAARFPGARRWERISRTAGVVEGDDWIDRLAMFEADATARADAADALERRGFARRLRLDADSARRLAGVVAELRSRMESGATAGTWSSLATWATALLERYVGDDRTGWPAAEAEAADRVAAVVERLADLDAVDGGAPTIDTFRRTLDSELDVALQRIGQLGEGVLVGSLSMAVGLSLDRVVVVGLAEGTFPDRRLDDSLLPDAERVAAGGELALRSDHIDHDHRYLLATVAAGKTTLCFPRGDMRRSGAPSATRWLLDDATLLARSSERLTTANLEGRAAEPWLDIVPSFAAAVGRLRFPATPQEHNLGVLTRGQALPNDAIVAAGTTMSAERRSERFTRYDGNLGTVDLRRADDEHVLSATRLEAWAACPHAYFVEHVLGVEIAEEPERRLRLDPIDRGGLVHEALRRFVAEGGNDREHLRQISAEVCDGLAARGRAGRRVFWKRDRARILDDLDRFFDRDIEWRALNHAEPIATEHRFDTTIPLSNGRELRVRGMIDRIDRRRDGSVVVVDYKTGRPDRYRHVDGSDPHQRGTRLQPIVYAAGARATLGPVPLRFDYWFVNSAARFARIGYDVTDEVERHVDVALTMVVSGIEQGVFPLHPPEAPSWNRVDCWFCCPDGLSAADVRRDWERKRTDPALAGYAALCEPA